MKLEEQINTWLLSNSEYREDINLANDLINYLEDVLYSDYEPTKQPNYDFRHRLEKWINNLSHDEDKISLFLLVKHIFFIGRHEFDTLFRVAFNEHIIKWIIDEISIKFNHDDFLKKIDNEVNRTWICPVTDSLRINGFYHVNNITGHELRPDWKSLSKLGDNKKIENYIIDNKIKRLVLIEDFVGSGTQMRKAITYASEIKRDLPILFVPLVICPKGMEKARSINESYPNIKVSPVVILNEDAILSVKPKDTESELFKKIRLLLDATKEKLQLDLLASQENDCLGMFGFKDTGSVVVMYSNCPNNTIPLIHHDTDDWSALFPRLNRV